MPSKGNIRNYGLDFLKGLAACFVVFMHVRFPGFYGDHLSSLGRFAVPVFFMTSGYFAYGATKEKTLKSIKRTSVYLIVAYLIALFSLFIISGFSFGRLWQLIDQKILNVNHFLRFVFLADSRISGVAWFLWSLLLCYVFKFFLGPKLRYIAYIGLFVRVAGSIQYPFLHLTIPVNTPWVTGIPFFIIGELLNENKEWVNHSVSSALAVGVAIMGFLIMLTSFFYPSLFWFIGTLLLSPALFVLFSRMDMKYNAMCLLGSVYAFFIYIVHPLVMHVYDAFRPLPSTAELWLRPWVVLFLTILLTVTYYSIKGVILKKKKSK